SQHVAPKILNLVFYLGGRTAKLFTPTFLKWQWTI
ncbi:unnamed protein product, partial [Allacma fusca]